MAGKRKRDPNVMKQINSFVDSYFFDNHRSPSMQAIADELGVSKSTAYYYISEMAEKGMLSYDGKTISTSSMQKSIHFANRAPLIGNIVCGTPEYSEENFKVACAISNSIERAKQNMMCKLLSALKTKLKKENLPLIPIENKYDFRHNAFESVKNYYNSARIKVTPGFSYLYKKINRCFLAYNAYKPCISYNGN